MRIKKYATILICLLLTASFAYAGSKTSAKYADDVGLQKLTSEIQALSVSNPQEWHKLQTKILHTGNNGEIIRGEFIKELVLDFVKTGLTYIIFANATIKQPAPISKAGYTQPSYGNGAWRGGDLQTYYPPNRGFSGTPQRVTLEPGIVIDRYGGTGRTFASPQGTPPWARALLHGAENRPLNTYTVAKPVTVDSGLAAPWFGQVGGETQYDFGQSIQQLLDGGFLK